MNEIIAAFLTLLLTAITGYVYMRALRSRKSESSSGKSKDSEPHTLDSTKVLASAHEAYTENKDAIIEDKVSETEIVNNAQMPETTPDWVVAIENASVTNKKYEPVVGYRPGIQPYITKDEPFGPIDSTDIDPKDVSVSQMLFEQHNWIYRNMRHRPSIIMGRKGSGKTAYLRTVFFDKKYDFYTEIRTDHALMHISKVIQGLVKEAVFPETLAELWETILWVCMLSEIRTSSVLSQDKLTQVNGYLEKLGARDASSADDVLWKMARMFDDVVESDPKDGLAEILRRFDRVEFRNTVSAVEESLKASGKTFVILMDSLDNFQLEINSVAYSLQGLLKFIGTMNKPRDVVDIRFCMPTELYRRIIKISSNPNKDFRRSLKLQWTASELILIGAQRLAFYLELYYPNYWKRLLPLDLTSRIDALKLFNAVLPKTIYNQAGFQEETISYILRHTQMLPRHFLILLNSIFKSGNNAQSLNPFPISEGRILNGVHQVDERIVTEIFVAFKITYPTAESVCKRCIPELGHKFSVGELHQVYTRHGKAIFDGDNLFDFQRMLMEIGAIGRVIKGRATDVYILGNFEFTVAHEIAISHDDELCIHPLFSGVFGNDNKERPVYPYGSGMDDDDYRDNFE
jgi:hypothetical protein